MSGTFVVLDLETTGLDPRTDEIIEIGMLRLENGRIGAVFHTLVRPSRSLPRRIQNLTGLDDAVLAGQPEWRDVHAAVLEFLGNAPVVGHHVGFDLAFLERHGGYRPPQAYDTADLARLVLPGLISYRLDALSRHLGVACRPEHRAMADARATAEVFILLLEHFRRLELTAQAAVHRILSQTPGSPWFPLVDQLVRSGAAAAADAARVISDPGNDWSGAAAEPGGPKAGEQCGGPVEDLLGVGGRLAAYLSGFEYREQQVQVAQAVQRALAEGNHLLVEAGTGTGKSFAYLVPAALWALAGGRRVVVSTHTVNLQDQLIEKDIPVLHQALNDSLKAVLLKGRSHYLCRRRWNTVLNQGGFQPEEGFLYARVAVWLHATRSGDRTELNLRPTETGYWDAVAAGDWGCAGGRCPFQGVCFLQRARRAAEGAHLVITNHSLLLSDLRTENRILPAYDALVIDEAHHLEDVATEQLGTTVSAAAFARWVDGVNRLAAAIGGFFPDNRDELEREGAEVANAARRFFSLAATRTRQLADAADDFPAIRLAPRAANLDKNAELSSRFQELSLRLNAFRKRFSRAVESLAETSGPLREELGAGLELETAAGSRLTADLEFVFQAGDQDYVFWAEADGRRSEEARLCAAPVHVGQILHEGLFQPGRPVILTSATLAVADSFSFFAERTGISEVPREYRESLVVGSPFDYASQVLLYVVDDLPVPGEPDEVYLNGVVHALGEIVRTTRGRTLVLFTAHKALQAVYSRLKMLCENEGIELLGHGIDGDRARLLEYFRNTPETVLFGASSFWEGVDVPGEALTCLVIVKLPFQPPNRPVLQARREEIRRRGRNDFTQLSLPQAVIRLKQGFGRLIRTTRDRGVVLILDNRLVKNRYGAVFLHSLPATAVSGPLKEALAAMVGFLGIDGGGRQ